MSGGDGGNIPLSRTPSAPLSRASLLDRGFPGVLLSIHPDPNPPYALDVGSIPSFRQTTKEGRLDPLCCLVSHARFELASNVPCKPCNYCISASGVSFLTGEFSDFSDHYFYICVGLYVSGWVYRFPDARSRQTE